MTKKQVAKKLNAVIKKYTKLMNAEAEAILVDANMWYGEKWFISYQLREHPNTKDRNGDMFITDGTLEEHDAKWFLWTTDEISE